MNVAATAADKTGNRGNAQKRLTESTQATPHAFQRTPKDNAIAFAVGGQHLRWVRTIAWRYSRQTEEEVANVQIEGQPASGLSLSNAGLAGFWPLSRIAGIM